MKFSGRHFSKDVILTTLRRYLRYKLSYRDVEELIGERGLKVDHSTVNRWVIKYAPLLAAAARRHKRAVGLSWRLDETYIKVAGGWKYYYRAVDKEGNTIDFLLTAKRDKRAALRFLRQAIRNNCTPVKINIDKSAQTPRRLRLTTMKRAQTSKFGNANTSTLSSNNPTGLSN